MAKTKPPNWDMIKEEYKTEYAAHGDVDIADLAKRHKLVYGTLRNRIWGDGWKNEALPMREAVLKETRAQVVPMIIKQRVELIDKHLHYLGGLRQASLSVLGKLADAGKITPALATKIIFDSLRAEKMLHEMVGSGPLRDVGEDEQRQALFSQFVEQHAEEFATLLNAPETKPN